MILNQINRIAYGKSEEEILSITKEEVLSLSTEDLSALHSIMIGPHVSLAITLLQRSGFFADLIPEIQAGLDLSSNGLNFKEIWPHTIRVVSQTPQILNVRWAALFHDLGKAKAFSVKNNKVTFHHHEYISAKIFNKFANRTRIFSDGQRSAIYFLISHLGYVEGYSSAWTDTAVRRFDKDINIFLDDLLTLSEADITTGRPENKRKILRRIQELKGRIARIREMDAKPRALPKGLGKEIAEKLSIPIGPDLGKIMKDLECKVETGVLSANEDFTYYIDYLRKNQVENTTNT